MMARRAVADLSKPWPLGLAEARQRWVALVAFIAVLGLALTVDHPLSQWAQTWPESIRVPLSQFTDYGESGWILIPSGVLLIVSALAALIVPRRLMKLALWQAAEFFGFIFAGVGAPSLVATLVKRAIGRGRPSHFADSGLLSFHPNWLDWTYQSFPSGHAATAFALAAVIGFIADRWFYPMLAFAAVIGVSRISLGVHYPSDVIGGAALGLIGAYAVRLVFARRRWLFEQRKDGRIEIRPLSSLKRLLRLRRRGSGPGRTQGRP